MTQEMKKASRQLEFEKAAEIRDRLGRLRQELSQMSHDDTLPKELAGQADMPSARTVRKVRHPSARRRKNEAVEKGKSMKRSKD